MVNEPEKRPLTTVCFDEYSPFCWVPDLCRRCHIEQLSDMRVSFPGMRIRMPPFRADQRKAGLRRGAEMVLFFLSWKVLVLAPDLCGAPSPTNGRRTTLPNANPSWDGFSPARPRMLGAQWEAMVQIIAACSGIGPIAPAWPSACAGQLRCRCVLGTAAPADPP